MVSSDLVEHRAGNATPEPMNVEIETVSIPLDPSQFDEIIDVRSPREFEEDHIPKAINLPVLSDLQREEIGILHKHSPFQARRAGAALVSENISNHLKGELSSRDPNWSPLLYCWRGGMRSKSFATVLRSIGWRARVLSGGYKAWRNFLIEDFERLLAESGFQFHVIAGLTGTGKTRLLKTLHEQGGQILDLERLANHRGSLLGAVGPQPSQKHFESLLYSSLGSFDPSRPIFIEAESSRIGKTYIPPALWKELGEAPVTELVLPRPERCKLLLEEYRHFPDDPESLSRPLERLRSLRGHSQVDAWQGMIAQGRWELFVDSILEHHYDLCYRRPGSPPSIYRLPSRKIELADCSEASFTAAARDLLTAHDHV